jgi:membrane associated rhomboid family serine protease
MIYIIPIPFPIKAKWFVIGYAVLEIALGSSGVSTGVAHFAHVGGMLWGLALLFWRRKQRKIFF